MQQNEIDLLPLRIASLCVYTSLKNDSCIKTISEIITASKENMDIKQVISLYSDLFNFLNQSEFSGSLADYIFDKVIYDENFVLYESSQNRYISLSYDAKNAFEKDVEVLNDIAYLTATELKAHLCTIYPENDSIIQWLPSWSNKHHKFKILNKNWAVGATSLAEHARTHGVGELAKHSVFYCNDSQELIPVKEFNPIDIAALAGYEKEREKLMQNTKALVEGKKANNVLLYGDRGTGKSTSVKSVFNYFKNKNLKLIEISKANLCHFQGIIGRLSKYNNKFIIFIDDLAFSETDESFFQLKVFLEGGVVEAPNNIVVYATTNRIHLIKESASSRTGDEIHRADTIDENLSLSERFGIIITFLSPDKQKFAFLVEQMAKGRNIKLSTQEIVIQAERWALLKGSRSLRVAKQCLDYLMSVE